MWSSQTLFSTYDEVGPEHLVMLDYMTGASIKQRLQTMNVQAPPQLLAVV
jgi:hypothetical protein